MNEPNTSLSDRIRHLEDIEEIRTLRFKYHYFINEVLLDRAAEIYAEDAYVRWSNAGEAKGHEQIVALFMTLPKTADFVKHFVSNHLVEIQGDRATGVAYVDARYAAGSTSSLIAGKYDEEYRRTSQGWRISHTVLTTYFKSDIRVGWADQVPTMHKT